MGRKHVIRQGESVMGLAEDNGLFPDTIWEHADNAALREKRASMSVLLPDDVVVIPEKRPKQETIPTGKRSVFRRRGIPGKLRMQLFENGRPRDEQDYRLTVDGEFIAEGKTDKEGFFEEFVSGKAKAGVLTVGPNDTQIRLAFGHLDPHDEVSGMQHRLNNLGFHCGEADGEVGDRTRSAIERFQAEHPKLEVTGEFDAETVDALAVMHDDVGEVPGA